MTLPGPGIHNIKDFVYFNKQRAVVASYLGVWGFGAAAPRLHQEFARPNAYTPTLFFPSCG